MSGARYRRVAPRLWRDGKFRSLNESARYVWLCLLTSPYHTPIPGLIVATTAELAVVHMLPESELLSALEELEQAGMIAVDMDCGLVFMPRAVRYNRPANANVVKGWSRTWDEIEACELCADVWAALDAEIQSQCPASVHTAFVKSFPHKVPETVSKPFRNRSETVSCTRTRTRTRTRARTRNPPGYAAPDDAASHHVDDTSAKDPPATASTPAKGNARNVRRPKPTPPKRSPKARLPLLVDMTADQVGKLTEAQAVWEVYRQLYQGKHGREPTPNSRFFVNLNRLVKHHDVSTLLLALRVYFEEPPFGLHEGARDMDRFIKHFDKLAPTPDEATREGLVAKMRQDQSYIDSIGRLTERFGNLTMLLPDTPQPEGDQNAT